MLTVLEVIRRTTEHFAQRGLASPRLNAELLVGRVLGLGRMQLYLQFERPLPEPELERLRPLVRRRAASEPLQYILGETEFAGLRLKVDRRALIPRPETEQLVDRLARHEAAPGLRRLLDLGTGSGAIALGLTGRLPGLSAVAVDRSAEAVDLARENAAATGLAGRVHFLIGSWYDPVGAEERFDAIVANPPYLSPGELAGAASEVRDFEPAGALVGGGPEGCGDLEAIIRGAAARLNPGGLLALETGPTQHARLLPLALASGLRDVESHQDLAGRDRFILARR